MLPSKELEIQKIAKQQHGVISLPQLHDLGVTEDEIRGRVDRGAWTKELRGVWRLSWAEPTWMQRTWSAWLWGGSEALISHCAAARLWELNAVKLDAIDLCAPYQLRTKVQWLRPHWTAPIPATMRRVRNGIGLTSPARTLVDLAGMVDDDTLQQALEQAFRRKISSVSEVRRVLRQMPASGKAGTGRIAKLLDRGANMLPEVKSKLERQALELFSRSGIPMPQCQYTIFEDDWFLGVVDFAWPDAKVIVEVEGFQFHSGRDAWDRDISRYNALTLHGWKVLRMTHTELKNEPQTFVKSLAAALERGTRRIPS